MLKEELLDIANEIIKTKYIVNAAGIYADKFHNICLIFLNSLLRLQFLFRIIFAN